MQAGQKSNGYV